MFHLVHLIILSIFLPVNGDIDSDKQAACDREVKIVAATKTLKAGEFYLFEDCKAWLYDAKNQKLLEYYDIEDKIRSGSPNEEIIRASSVLTCNPEHGLGLLYARIVTKEAAYEFYKYEEFKNVSAWKSIDVEELREANEAATNTEIKRVVDTIGTACDSDGQRTFQHFHKYIRENSFIYNQQNRESTKRETQNIYAPYDINNRIKESSSFPEALAFQFDVKRKNQKALFVYENTIFYSKSDDGSHWVTTEANVGQVFGCKSSIMTIIVIFVAIVVFLVILGAVTVVTTLFVRQNKFEDDVSTVATVSNRKAPPKTVKGIK